jgi:acyl-CoA thioester hydrolase
MAFTDRIRVRYAEVDAQGVVFNAHWLTYFDVALTRYCEHLGYDPKQTWTEGGLFDLMLVATRLEWKGSAGFEDVVEIAVSPTRLGTSSFDLTFTASVGGGQVVIATTTYVTVPPGKQESMPIPDALRGKLERDLVD